MRTLILIFTFAMVCFGVSLNGPLDSATDANDNGGLILIVELLFMIGFFYIVLKFINLVRRR